ncbi:MAG: hypothetical protein SV186_04550 [Candidatus Nanohaloarchaea archaeon]|nr:hypothetical protein [Candidatus Nanohaloarchaea archaeon]
MSSRIDEVIETVEQKVENGLERLVETDKVKFEDAAAGGTVIAGTGTAAAASSGEPVVAFLGGLWTTTGALIAVGEGSYPFRAARPFYRARDIGRGQVYDTFRADQVRDEIDIDAVQEEYDDIDIEERLMAHYDAETAAEAYNEFQDHAVEAGRQHYVNDLTDPAAIADQVLNDGLRGVLPDYRVASDVEQVYRTEDLDPYSIQEELIAGLGDFLLDEIDGDRAEQVADGLDVIQDEPDPDYLDELGIEEDADRDDLYDEVIDDMVFQGQCIAQNKDESFQDELQGRYNAANRFDAAAAVDALEEHDYEIFEIQDPSIMANIHSDLGTCKRNYKEDDNEFQDWAEDDGTTILGFRRGDEDEWVGMTRNYDLDASGRDVFGVDTWEIPYKPGREGGAPDGACDFENYGDVLHAEALASVRWGLDNGHDYVVSGTRDGRIKHAREINPNRDTSMALRGLNDKKTHYSFSPMISKQEQTVHVLMEDDFDGYRA